MWVRWTESMLQKPLNCCLSLFTLSSYTEQTKFWMPSSLLKRVVVKVNLFCCGRISLCALMCYWLNLFARPWAPNSILILFSAFFCLRQWEVGEMNEKEREKKKSNLESGLPSLLSPSRFFLWLIEVQYRLQESKQTLYVFQGLNSCETAVFGASEMRSKCFLSQLLARDCCCVLWMIFKLQKWDSVWSSLKFNRIWRQ